MKVKKIIFVVIVLSALIFLLITLIFFIRFSSLGYMENIPFKSFYAEKEARRIAVNGCIKEGESLGKATYNKFSNTWWFETNIQVSEDDCSPICEVSESSKTAKLFWRCK